MFIYITEDKSITNINSSQVLSRLRTIVNIIGEYTLGFTESDIGLHSIRSGGAMAIFFCQVFLQYLDEIFVEDKGDGSEPICIDHELDFNNLSLN